MTLHRHGGKDWESDSACAWCECDRLRSRLAEAEALRKDAERYRWLRTQHANILLGPVHVAGVGALTSTGLDAAIDAHLAEDA